MEIVKFIKNSFIFISLIGVAMWAGIVWKAENEDELREACSPIQWVTGSVHDFSAALTGREPVWTLRVQNYLMRGCYYFVWRVAQNNVDPGEPAEGGVRTK